MNKSLLAISFSVLFVFIAAAPSVISILKMDCDISMVIDLNEEEEKKEGKEPLNDIEIEVIHQLSLDLHFKDRLNFPVLEFYSNSYASNDIELISPPPEQISI